MLLPFRQKKAASALEYTLLVTIILTAILVTQKYVVRGFAGRWKAVGDSFGMGKQYDPQKTLECTWSQEYDKWYDRACYEEKWDTDYSGRLNGCTTGCIDRANNGQAVCGGSSSCECALYVPWFGLGCIYYSPECCYSSCKRLCAESVSNASVTACSDVGTINCSGDADENL